MNEINNNNSKDVTKISPSWGITFS
jgi:hypothetical protein